jgi:TonB family protein
MRRTLIVKHKFKGKLIKTYRLTGGQTTVGAYRQAKIHLLGPQIAGLVCMIEKTPKGWRILDLGSEPDLKADNKKFCEMDFKSRCLVQVGHNHLELQNLEEAREVFSPEIQGQLDGKSTLYVARWRSRIIESSFNKQDVANLKSENVQVEEIKISKKASIPHEDITISSELRKPLLSSFAVFVVFMIVFIGIPGLKTQEPQVKPKDNIYTRMIYDSKLLNERKQQLQSSGSKVLKGLGGQGQNQAANVKRAAQPESKAVASIRQAGISSIINKIASQASKSALLVAKLAAMPQADAAIDAQKINNIGQIRGAQGAGGKSDILSGANGFKVGAIGTAGKGGGNQGGYRKGSDLGDGGVGQGNIAIDDTETIVEGGLEKEVIAKIIKEHLGQIRYCYDRQLASDSALHGKVKVNFSIDSGGVVDSQSVGESTMNNAMIEECILRRIATWKFPKPKGGTKVLVSYPFLFKSVN